MLVVKDSMVLIHLAKTTLLECSCDYFGRVVIPVGIQQEVTRPGHPDALLIKELIKQRKITVKEIVNKSLLHRAQQFNIQHGEAEAVALYWELDADVLATDDDNVRKKRELLQLKLIGTPVIMLELYRKKRIDKAKLYEAISRMKEIGWFSQTIWDKIIMEAEHG